MKLFRHHPPLGFSLAEVLLVVAMVGFLTGIGAPVYQTLQVSNELDVATNTLVQDLYRAQSASRNVSQDNSWGVAINGQTITLFRGASYASRNSAFDDNYTLPSSIAMTGSTAIVYDKLTGWPQATGSFNLTGGGKTRTVSVNARGMVEF